MRWPEGTKNNGGLYYPRPKECRHRLVPRYERRGYRGRRRVANVRLALRRGKIDRWHEDCGFLQRWEQAILNAEGVDAWSQAWEEDKLERGVDRKGNIDPEVDPKGAARQQAAINAKLYNQEERRKTFLERIAPRLERYRKQIEEHPEFENKNSAGADWLHYIETVARTAADVHKGLEKLHAIFGHDAKNVRVEHTHRIEGSEELDALIGDSFQRLGEGAPREELKDAEVVILEATTEGDAGDVTAD